MPDIFYLMARWWKQMLVIIILALVAVGAVVFFERPEYLSVATALPANSALSDKSSVFNNNIQSLSPNLGSADELDMIIGTAQLDTIYLAVATAFNIWDHYNTEEKGEAAVYKAAAILKDHTNVSKSGYSELKVKVWDTDKNLAPQLANAIVDQLNIIHRDLQNENNRAILARLIAARDDILPSIDTLSTSTIDLARKNGLSDQLQQYEKLIGQYKLIVDTKPAALVIVEKARPSAYPDKPRRVMTLVATAVLAFLFSLLVALVLERRKKPVL